MKTLKVLSLAIAIITLISFDSTAQTGLGQGYGYGYGFGRGFGAYCYNLPNITTDQLTQIETLRAKHLQATSQLHADLAVKRSELRALRISDPTNISAINKKIDEIAAIRTELAKQREAHRLEIRALLTDEQKAVFDTRPYGYGRGMGAGYGRGRGKGRGHRGGYGFRGGW